MPTSIEESVKRDGPDAPAVVTTTVGAIALQGVRRASPQLGERVAVLGLGLIGQITVQLVRAAGCDVIGLDLDPARVERARSLGMEHGASAPDAMKAVVQELNEQIGVAFIQAAWDNLRMLNEKLKLVVENLLREQEKKSPIQRDILQI